MAAIRVGRYKLKLPRSRLLRIIIGLGLILGGFLGFLPILGFWMLPLGLMVLSYDLPVTRRWRRRGEVALNRWRRKRTK